MRTIWLLILLIPSLASAQTQWEADIPAARQHTFHTLDLGPEITAHLDSEGANLRILDPKGTEVPYLMSGEQHTDQSVQLNWYPRVGGRYHRRWYTRAIFENARRDAIEEIVLKIRNADVRQRFWLSGSDNMQDWYIIKEDFHYEAAYDPGSTYNLLTLQFPRVDYRYYKVEIRHYWEEPISIQGAGYYRVKEKKGHYQEIKGLEVFQTDDTLGKKSYVEVDLGANHYVDRLHLMIDGPDMYLRQAELEHASGGSFREDFELSSREVSQFRFEGLRASKLRITIENKDDLPIRVVGVRAYQLKKFVTAKLEPGVDYRMLLEPEGHPAPEYDLIHFQDQIPRNRPRLKVDSAFQIHLPPGLDADVSQVQQVPYPKLMEMTHKTGTHQEDGKQASEEVEPFFKNKAVLWVGIGVILVLMVGFSYSLLKDKGSV